MWSRPESDETLVRRLLPCTIPDRSDCTRAWAEWQISAGETAVLNYIRIENNTGEPDEDILQEAMLIAYLGVERGNYKSRDGVPFSAYVKGITRNKIREARRRERYYTNLEEIVYAPVDLVDRQTETVVEYREQHQALHNGLLELPLQRRQVLERYIRGESTAEIAREMTITRDLVRQLKFRGLRTLRKMSVFSKIYKYFAV